jgi:hypothetical protein
MVRTVTVSAALMVSAGVRSGFNRIIIVADINKLAGIEAGPLADYIAMLALTQLVPWICASNCPAS